MRNKSLLSAALCCALLALASLKLASGEAIESNTIILGERGPRDALLVKKHVEVGWRLFNRVSETLTYSGNGLTRITQVEALDQHTDGNGAVAAVVSGGPGHSHVTIKFVSSWNRGIDFVVKIYGAK